MEFSKEFVTKAKRKLAGHQNGDRCKFNTIGNITLEDIKEKINEQEGKCFYCEEKLLFDDWVPYCWYQFSIDRLDDDLPHDADNCVISCYYCNCSQVMKSQKKMHGYGLEDHKVCTQDCPAEHQLQKPHITQLLSELRSQYNQPKLIEESYIQVLQPEEIIALDIIQPHNRLENVFNKVKNFIRSFWN